MAVPGSAGELPAPRYVCDSCGALFHHIPETCLICAGKIRPRAGTVAAESPVDTRRKRILYGFVAAWVLLLGAIVAYTALDDPTKGHAGRMVYPSELALQNSRRGTPPDPVNGARLFRLTRSDRIERVNGPPEVTPSDVWIRVTSGPHAGRTGVVVW